MFEILPIYCDPGACNWHEVNVTSQNICRAGIKPVVGMVPGVKFCDFGHLLQRIRG